MASVASLEEQVAAALRRMGLSGNDSILVLGVSGLFSIVCTGYKSPIG